jgi:hypothetical protein
MEANKITYSEILMGPTRSVEKKPLQRFERKFAIRPAGIGMSYAFLRQVCRSDKEYPKDRVNSLYFDTADLEQYEKSAAGEFRKNKVRIRWYDSDAAGRRGMPVYLELKSREGFASSKQRKKFRVPLESLKLENLSQGILDKSTINETLASFKLFLENPIKPIIVISYQRYRFTELQTGVRVCLDYDIRAFVVAPDLGRRGRDVRLEGGVIEVKGPSIELPITLRYMKQLDVDWSRFSKYGGCLDAYFTRIEH